MSRPWRYSFSQLDQWGQCARKYRYSYVDRIPRGPKGVEAFMGIQVHAVVERLYRWVTGNGMDAKPLPTLDAVVTRFDTNWNAELQKEPAPLVIAKRGMKLGDYELIGRSAVRNAFRECASDLEHVANELHEIEQRVEFDVSGIPMLGYIDRLSIPLDPATARPSGWARIHDYKTSARPKSQTDADADHQLRLYAIAAIERYPELADFTAILDWHFLAVGNGARVYSKATPESFAVTAEWVTSTVDQIEGARKLSTVRDAPTLDQIYPANPSPLCAWCSFRGICPEGK